MWVEADCNLISGESLVRQSYMEYNSYRKSLEKNVNIYGSRMCLGIAGHYLRF